MVWVDGEMVIWVVVGYVTQTLYQEDLASKARPLGLSHISSSTNLVGNCQDVREVLYSVVSLNLSSC